MGLQRHLKVMGIFARLNYRDGKPDYLVNDVPVASAQQLPWNKRKLLGPVVIAAVKTFYL